MIPDAVKPFLWSYNIDALDIQRDKKRIITNVLNLGTQQATDWIFDVYSREEIKDSLRNPLLGEWNNKSFNFWTFMLDAKPNILPTRKRL